MNNKLSTTQQNVLAFLAGTGSPVRVSPRTVKVLEALGFVTVRDDGRMLHYEATPVGRQILAAYQVKPEDCKF